MHMLSQHDLGKVCQHSYEKRIALKPATSLIQEAARRGPIVLLLQNHHARRDK